MENSNKGLIRFYQILIAFQALLILSSCWLIAETGRWVPNLVCIATNLVFGVWNVSMLKHIKKS